MTPRDVVAMLLILLAALVLLLTLRLCHERARVSGEWTRKLAHIGTGAMSISFPWIFSSRIPVFMVCGASITLLLAMRHVPFMRRHLSGALDDVARESWGYFYFPFSVALLFQFTHGDKMLYSIPLLVLTIAATVAA